MFLSHSVLSLQQAWHLEHVHGGMALHLWMLVESCGGCSVREAMSDTMGVLS